MLWGKRNLMYTNRIIYAHSTMGTAFPFISLQGGLIFRCSFIYGILLVDFITLFTKILLLPFDFKES